MRREVFFAAIAVVVSIFVLTGIAMAEKGFYKRIASQEKRIESGVASGKITRAEAETLKSNLNDIRIQYDNLKANGALTPAEYRKLEEALDQNSAMIYRKKSSEVAPLP